jgi:hypothetical protein
MALQLRKAQRSKAYFKLGVSAPSGGGKTAGSLLIAYGLMKEQYPTLPEAEIWAKIAIIDTENGSGELYVNSEIAGTKFGEYLALTLPAPYTAEKYIEAIDLCAANGVEVCIIDSTTHLWSGEGGLLEQQANASKRTNNSYTAWRDITPLHAAFVQKMLTTPMHILATMRAKQEYSIEKDDKGKASVKKLGLEPEQRKGMEYEFTTFFEIDIDHTAYGAKDRTSIFDQQYFKITPQVGHKLMRWLMNVPDAEQVVIATAVPHVAEAEVSLKALKDEVIVLCKALGGAKDEGLMALVKSYEASGNPNKIESAEKLMELKGKLETYSELKNIEKQGENN